MQASGKIKRDVTQMISAFEAGDVDNFLSMVHGSLITLSGGEDQLKLVLTDALEKLNEVGIKFVSSEVQDPGEVYIAGDKIVVFVPRVSVMEIQGQKMKSMSFLVAIKDPNSEWKYLDGSGLRNKQHLLWQLIPELQKDVRFPPNYIEPVPQ